MSTFPFLQPGFMRRMLKKQRLDDVKKKNESYKEDDGGRYLVSMAESRIEKK